MEPYVYIDRKYIMSKIGGEMFLHHQASMILKSRKAMTNLKLGHPRVHINSIKQL